MKTHYRAFVAVLNMGLGHAARSLPIIRFLKDQDWDLYVGSSGRSLDFLKLELNDVQFIELPDYNLKYTTRGVSLNLLLKSIPEVLEKIRLENTFTGQLVEDKKINVILSDHRYGCYHPTIPSFFLTHQLRFIAPGVLRPFEFIGLWFNRYFHKNYTGVILPDYEENGQGKISGRLSKLYRNSTGLFSGILSSLIRENYPQDIDILFAVSGPEPQRTVLEKLIFSQIDEVPGKKVLVLGKPEKNGTSKISNDLEVYEYANRNLMQNLFNRSRLIVARSGYSTLMEILELQKNAFFIPTPGQTEQMYLANRLEQKGYFYSTRQDRLNLAEQIPEALKYKGVPGNFKTQDSVKTIFQILSESLSSKF